jgi:hypothetical protein
MKTISALMVIAIGVLGGINFHLWRELEAGRRQIAVLTSQAQERQAATAASPVPTPAPTPAQTSTVADQASQQVASPDNSVRTGSSLDSILAQMQSPEGQARTRARMRPALELSLPDLDQVLGLTAAEKDKLLDLLTAQQVRGMTTLAPENESAQESEARQQKRQETDGAEQQALLGDKYPKWQDYQETVTVRRQGRDLHAALDAAGIPLTQTKERALVDALVAELRSINQTAQNKILGVPVQLRPESRERLLYAATPYLSMQQLDEYEALLERQAAMVEALTSLRPEPGQ